MAVHELIETSEKCRDKSALIGLEINVVINSELSFDFQLEYIY